MVDVQPHRSKQERRQRRNALEQSQRRQAARGENVEVAATAQELSAPVAVAFGIATDQQAGWPLRAVAEVERQGRPSSLADLSDKLSFVVLWFCELEQKAGLHLRHAMDLHGLKVNPPSYQGAYRSDADGRGYTLEYAIAWHSLNAANDPPRAGDELAAMWLVHWSDLAGRKWQGQLIDVMQPNEPGWNFLRAAT